MRRQRFYRPIWAIPSAITIILGAGSAPEAAAAESAGAAPTQELGEVVVTGSRIVRRDYTAQSPIVTVQAETFEDRSSVGIESALNELPQFHVAGSAQTNSSASTPFPAATAAPGAATVNLRGLGLNRSLVLVDGRRVQPVNGALVVDLNTIPSAAIQSVEVISGGAAAVYGADAISGVVNLILKKNFEGAQFDAQYGITQHGDNQEIQLSGLLGSNFSEDRGNVMLGISYSDRGTTYSRNRDWVRKGWADPGTGGQGSAILASGIPMYNPGGGVVWAIDPNGHVFNPNDPVGTGYSGPLGGDSGFKLNPDGSLAWNDREHSTLGLPLKRYSLFGSSNYKLFDHASLFTEVRFTETKVHTQGFNSQIYNLWNASVPYNQAYDDPDSPTFGMGPSGFAYHPVPAELADILNARTGGTGFDPLTAPWTYESGTDFFPPYSTDTTSNVFQTIVGFRGDIPGTRDWTYEVYGSHGKSTVDAQQTDGFPSVENFRTLITANQYGLNWANPGFISVAGTCTSGLPIFNPDGSVNNNHVTTQDCQDWSILRTNNISTLQQEVFEANMQGSLIDMWAGTLQFAAGVDARAERFAFDPDSGYNANQLTANLAQNIILPVSVRGKTSVREAYAEFAIPLISGVPFIQKFELDPGIRISDYNTSGSLTTYKILGDWEVNNWVRFRGGYQRANRAPNVTELFTPKGGSALAVGVDGCANWSTTPDWGNVAANPNRLNVQAICQELMVRGGAPSSFYVPGTASADGYDLNVLGTHTPFPFKIGVEEGNRNLDSEKAKTTTIGVVLRSPFSAPALQGTSLSVDYFDITVSGAIGTPSHDTIYQQCLDAKYNSLVGDAPGSHTGAELADNNPFCALIEREYLPFFTGSDRKFKAQYINQGGIKTHGIDVSLDWRAQLGSIGLESVPGSISAGVQFSHLGSYAVSPYPGGEFVEYNGTVVNSSYRNRFFSTFGYANGPFSLGLRWQHLPGLNVAPGANASALGVKSHDQFDLFGRWELDQRYELRFGIDNLLDADPEIVGATRVLNTDGTVNTALSNNALGSSSPNNDVFGRRFFAGFKISL